MNPLNESEIAELRSILAERQSYSGSELAVAYRVEREQDRKPIEELAAGYWQLVMGETKTDLRTFTKLLSILGRSIQNFEADQRAVAMQSRAEAQQEADRKLRDEILERSRPAQERLDAAVAGIFGPDWQQRLNSGDLVQAPYLVDYEAGTVTTIVAVLAGPCAELQAALAGIESVFRYQTLATPRQLQDAKDNFDAAVEIHLAKQRIPA